MRGCEYQALTLPLARPFVISRGRATDVSVVRVRIEEGTSCGLGECTPTLRYQQTPHSVLQQLEAVAEDLRHGLSRQDLQLRLPAGSARNALDCALWDLECKQRHADLWTITDVTRPVTIITAQTVSIGTVEEMASSAADASDAGARLLKVKLDNCDPVNRVQAIREAVPCARIIADANESWDDADLQSRCRALANLDVEMIEQPLPADHDGALREFDHPLLICADESCHTLSDIDALKDRYDMINIKLDKSGGLTEALAMTEKAKAEGLKFMVGCMLGSSMAMRPALPIAAQAAVADLDGPIWLAHDVADGLVYRDGGIQTR